METNQRLIEGAIVRNRLMRAERLRHKQNLSTNWRGRLERLSAFPTAVYNRQLGAWQLRLPNV